MENQDVSMIDKRELIDIADEQDRNYWAARLGVSSETLKSAIRAIRNLELIKIKEYLNMTKTNQTASQQI
ncbi:DUF3606 domain-containing protein [Pedobacter fastidiosus]|uniref:DUF3606 domain-containing protein n=1 Tax=Pedobacter fastidiosus TaxID=2765361 RepID=A0ABR7KRW4_9SPHI|nr:DUF3606 domain-containing protein [Pedobacter fastidiosus]MBC6110497.1 DUF3606 domain-containing protein [Pedobacter fastidiosus]